MKRWFLTTLLTLLGCASPQVSQDHPFALDLENIDTMALRAHNAQLLRDPRYVHSILRHAEKVEPTREYDFTTLTNLVSEFEKRGGVVVFVPFDETMKIKLPRQADFYPVCKGGVNRSQVSYVVLSELTKGKDRARVELPHGVAIGYESREAKPMAYEIDQVATDTYTPIDKLGGNAYFEAAMNVSRPKRFGYEHTGVCKGLNKPPYDCNTDQQRKHFSDNYWSQKGEQRKVYITYGSSGVTSLERADPSLTTIIVFAMEDYVSQVANSNPHAGKEDFIEAFKQMRKKISSVLVMDK